MEGSDTRSRSSLPPGKGGEVLVQVKAQVMTKDESTGLWRPVKSNSISLLTVRKDEHNQYFISGHQISDLQEVFECQLSAHMSYHRTDNTSTFHHWKTDSYRHGVTFLNLTDARRFERVVRRAIQEISPPRGSQSEEEIFVKTDTILLDCDTDPIVPSRPHKPKRLTEEYKSTCSSSERSRESSASDRDSPTGATKLTAPESALSQSRPITSSQSKLSVTPPASNDDTSTLAAVKPSSASAIICTTSSGSSGGVIAHSVSSGNDPALPPRASTTTPPPALSSSTLNTAARTSTPTSVHSSSRNAYTDYRNDYFTKKQPKSDFDVLDSALDKPARDIRTETTLGTKITSLTDLRLGDSPQLKPKNTPPLPRKKKKRRRYPASGGLCGCFSSHSLSGDEYS